MLKLSATKHSDLLGFMSCFPPILSKSAPNDAAGARLVDTSIVDSKLFSYPNLHKIIGTCKTVKYTVEVESIVSSNFVELYKEHLRVGPLTDTFMEKFGICLDTNYEGECVRRVSECEAWQMSKAYVCYIPKRNS